MGQTFLLGATSWRIEEITRDRVIVSPRPGAAAAVPFWHGESVGRPRELGEAIGAFARWAVEQDEATLAREYDLDPAAARNLLEYLREQRAATRALPSDRCVVVERFRDEIGDWRLCLLTPFGGRVHAAWGLALAARVRAQLGLDPGVIWSDDGVVLHLPDADEAPAGELALISPDEAEELVVAELGKSALFGARFRESAARALLIPRARPGRRTPLWQQRLKAQALLEVARRYPEFPIVLETYRECLRDVLDVPGLVDIVRRLASGEIALVEVETADASPFAASLLFDYIAAYMYEDDTPRAERRALALALDRDLLRELIGQEDLRELLDAAAVTQVEEELQHRAEGRRARDRDGVDDLLRALGDLNEDEVRRRVTEPEEAASWLAALEGEGRALRVRIAGETRWIAASDAGMYRDALGTELSPGMPEVFLADVPDARHVLVRRWARTHGPFLGEALAVRYGVDVSAELAELEAAGELVRGELRPLGTEREWCDPEVVRRLRRVSLANARREIAPVDAATLARFVPMWQGVAVTGGAPLGVAADRLREALAALQGIALPLELWERDVLPARVPGYTVSLLDDLCARGEVMWVGSGATSGRGGRVAFYLRADAALLGPPPGTVEAPSGALHELLRARLARGAAFFADVLVEETEAPPEELRAALWDLVWAGEVTNDVVAPLRARPPTAARPASSGAVATARVVPAPRFSSAGRHHRGISGRSRVPRGTPPLQGRWSLTSAVFAVAPVDTEARPRAWAELLLQRYGVVTREHVRAEGLPGGFAALYPAFSALEVLGKARRGYFVEGLGGAQFALPGAVDMLRADGAARRVPLVLAGADPAQLYGAALRWPDTAARALPRRSGAYTVLLAGRPLLALEPGGRTLTLLSAAADQVDAALVELVAAVHEGRVPHLALETIAGVPAAESSWRERLLELGFRPGLRRLTLARRY